MHNMHHESMLSAFPKGFSIMHVTTKILMLAITEVTACSKIYFRYNNMGTN